MADRREGDWNCDACDAHNFANRTACFKCKANKDGSPAAPAARRPRNNRPARAARPVETREGDWNCSECDAHNFASRARCFKCRNPRADVQAALDAGATPWVCSGCGGNNFADRTSCFKCREPKSDDAIVATEVVPRARRRNRGRRDLRAGDWICSNCDDHQFASRTECRECGTSKAETDVVSQEDAMRPGDWMCPACNDHQFASRMECRACGEARPDGIPAAPVKKSAHAAVAEDDEEAWVCSCDAENQASAVTCKDCGAEKAEF